MAVPTAPPYHCAHTAALLRRTGDAARATHCIGASPFRAIRWLARHRLLCCRLTSFLYTPCCLWRFPCALALFCRRFRWPLPSFIPTPHLLPPYPAVDGWMDISLWLDGWFWRCTTGGRLRANMWWTLLCAACAVLDARAWRAQRTARAARARNKHNVAALYQPHSHGTGSLLSARRWRHDDIATSGMLARSALSNNALSRA